ncbi:MAG: TIR domain-containing protein, partial [bacterium]|nr:TIR domain-containing protein [bacterium]
KEYKQIIAVNPNDFEVRLMAADLLLKQNNIPDAVEQFERIADHYLIVCLGDKAIAMYKRILQIMPNHQSVLLKLADIYSRRGMLNEARQLYLDLPKEQSTAPDKPLILDGEYFEEGKEREDKSKSVEQFKPPTRGLPPTPTRGGDEEEGDQVVCTVFASPEVKTAGDILVQVFAHLYNKLKEAERMAQEFDKDAERRGKRSLPAKIQHGTKLTFQLSLKGIPVNEPVQTITWWGHIESVAFGAEIPADFKKETIIGKVFISQDTIPIGTITFKIKVKQTEDQIKPIPTGEAKIYKYAFISYASKDRPEVLHRVQMLSLLKIGFFQDILNLESGSKWEKELYRNIDKADVFFLFWSSAARKSEWVKKEISYAIERKQGDEENPPDIIPVIIEGPPVPAP